MNQMNKTCKLKKNKYELYLKKNVKLQYQKTINNITKAKQDEILPICSNKGLKKYNSIETPD